MKRKTNDAAPYLFHQGTNGRAYEYLGAHKTSSGYVFRVWAPNAKQVYVAGNFNGWGDNAPMTRITEKGIWECELMNGTFGSGELYKYRILTNDGRTLYKADPYGAFCEVPPETASVFFESKYKWNDNGWLAYRSEYMMDCYAKPMNIYELNVGSWKRKEDGSRYSYRELAGLLAPYIKKMGYTHIELMPVAEHPFEGSWGYQVCGYFAPSARWGNPDDFRYFVDHMHKSGIGVILDWVPAHFPKDAHGLYEFDGQPLYEYQGADRQEHAGWGTRRFDVGREEVQSFLISNAVFWAREFHADGLRVDAVASMLYLDYDKKPGEWIPNIYGDHRCLEAISFFRKLNGVMKAEAPDTLMIAEESTAWANVTGFENEGLGFSYKWNMGWMNDTLDYAGTDPYFRSGNHSKLTFPLCYSFSEKFVLPISHDEVVHGKKSFLDKMPGDYENKFAGARLFGMYQMCFPGKKLNFMGYEIGQFREWDYEGQIEWFLLGYDAHNKLQTFFRELNCMYLSEPALWERDCIWEGFNWIYPDMKDISVSAFERIAEDGSKLICVFNFTPVKRENFAVCPVDAGEYREVFNSDNEKYGGSGLLNQGRLKASASENRNATVRIDLPPLSCVILRKHK